ncbi:ubiquitin-protein ligase [Vairimorpha apis BRL 01]|uniref:Ubiquitin-protein ligase n=1 Tax=Vairimorpha apis BRL 01 TaxID=1037528 RepID=T0MF34_9MICR|nr:ubiquitin-protein ligase [Vairimorpha apis BRL 01]
MAIHNAKETLKKCLKHSEKIDKILKNIYREVEYTKMNAVEEFKPFNEPKTNIDLLLNFYNIFLKISKFFETEMNIDNCFENKILDKGKNLLEMKNKLENFEKIMIVKILLQEINSLLQNLNIKVEQIFFKNLILEKDKLKEMNELFLFLENFTETKNLLKKISSTIYQRSNFDFIKNDKNLLLEKIKSLEDNLSFINFYTIKLLGDKNGNSINLVIADILLIIENEEKLENIPFLIELNYHLKHNDEKKIKEIEELYVYKDQIYKLMCNIFLTFVDNIQKISKSNDFCDVEKISIDLKIAMDKMSEYSQISKIFIKNYGPFFKTQTLNDFFLKMCSSLIKKLFEISEDLPSLKKSIYLINNLYIFQYYNVENIDVKKFIEENINNITNTFQNELKDRSSDRLSKFIDSNLSSLKSYYLSDEIKEKIVPKLKK